jgi:predicted PurR-regulated permease PerM
VAVTASNRRTPIPKSMDRAQFENILKNSSQIAILLVGVLAFAVAMALGKFILAPISLAIVIGLMFGPVSDIMEKRGVPSALSAGVVVIAFLALIVMFGMLFAAPISEWVARGPALWVKLQSQLADLREPFAAVGAVQEQLKSAMGEDSAAMTVEVQDGGPMQDVALMVPTLLADILLFLAGLYFFLATRRNMRLTMLSLCFSRRMRWRAAHVFRDVESKVSRFLISATVINLGVGFATFLAMWALGMPSPLLWGGLAAVLNFIPYIGQAIMLVVLFAVGLGTYTDWVPILLPVAAYAAINITADQLIFPHLVGKALTLNPFIIFVSIAFWMWLWGPMGGFVAVPSLLVLQSFIMHVFPSTANVPKVVQAKLEAKANADVRAAEPTNAPPEPPPAEKLAPKPKRRARKAVATASP